MKWNEFLEKLVAAKKIGKDKKISVPVLAALIFSGAFDSMVEGEPDVGKYTVMFEEIKKIKKSKASLPSKKSGEFIGLDDVESMTQLAIWRSQRSPIVKKIGIEDLFAGPLKSYGFDRVTKENSIFTFIRGGNKTSKPVYGTPKWSDIFKDDKLDFFKDRLLLLYGVVHDVKILPYGPDKEKERLCFKVFTGHELTDELVIWPKRDTGKLSAAYKEEIKDGVMAAFHVRPSVYNSKKTGTVMSMVRFSSK